MNLSATGDYKHWTGTQGPGGQGGIKGPRVLCCTVPDLSLNPQAICYKPELTAISCTFSLCKGVVDSRSLFSNLLDLHIGVGTGGMCPPPSFHKLLYKLLTTLGVVLTMPPSQSKSLSYATASV